MTHTRAWTTTQAGNNVARLNATVAGAGFDFAYTDTDALQVELVSAADLATITATSITGDAGLDVMAINLLLFADTGIGVMGDAFDTQVTIWTPTTPPPAVCF